MDAYSIAEDGRVVIGVDCEGISRTRNLALIQVSAVPDKSSLDTNSC
jgi:hypothetical protein